MKMSKSEKYELVTTLATECDMKWSCADILNFHYFNDNGLIAAKRFNDERIADMVAKGIVPSGWIVAYGGFASSESNHLVELQQKKRKEKISTMVALEMLEDHVALQEKMINSKTQKDPWGAFCAKHARNAKRG